MGDCTNRLFITIGDDATGMFQLRKKVSGVINPYPIPVNAIVQIHFPAFDPTVPVMLSSAVLGEVTIVDAALSTISFAMPKAKSLLLNPGESQKVDVVIIDVDNGNKEYTLTSAAVISIAERANP